MLVTKLDEKSINLIVSRIVPITLVCKRYRCTRPIANAVRLTLSNFAMQNAKLILNSGKNPFGTIDNIPECIFIGMALLKAFSPNEITGEFTLYNECIEHCISKYRINTEDRRIWKAIDSFVG